MMETALFILLGLAAGVLSGLIGIGGGILVVPALAFLFGFTQHQAQGTTLAMMVPPIGIFAALTYWKAGNVDVKAAALLCAGFFLGGYLGARMAASLSSPALEKVFGLVLLAVSLRMIFAR
ncbi:MAG: sulfite exporter TauE/SafE family protein [Deltaproteobacteria bacterium]|nr:sulfite exporter TauE/SafE family protein [Deltaproteobacteria bacterium]